MFDKPTVVIGGNRYSVPLGTYQGPHTLVRVRKINDEYLIIMDLNSDEELARHKIPADKGKLLKNSDHAREKSKKIPNLIREIAFKFPDPSAVSRFLEGIHQEKPRYIRDQLLLIQSAIQDRSPDIIAKALDFCEKNKLYSAVDFKDAILHYAKEQHKEEPALEKPDVVPLSPDSMEVIKTKPQIRDIKEYAKLFRKDY